MADIDIDFEIGQQVEVNTAYLETEPERWESATVHEVRTEGLSDRFIEVEYASGGVAAVMKSRVRPAQSKIYWQMVGRGLRSAEQIVMSAHRTDLQRTADDIRDGIAQLAKSQGWGVSQAHSFAFGSLSRVVDSGIDPEQIRAVSLGLQQGTARL